jgi:undecaprenyl-diphosphatase
MINAFISLDHRLFYFIHVTIKNSFFDWLMPIMSNGQLWAAPLGFACVLAIYFGRKRGMFAVVLLIIAVGLSDFSGNVLKHIISRCRPLGSELDSFPSNHASNSFAFALLASFCWRNRWVRITVYAIALTVGFSRVYIGAHYPADVVAGALWGTLAGAFVIMLSRKYFPGFHDENAHP